jgi:hypothetical protein
VCDFVGRPLVKNLIRLIACINQRGQIRAPMAMKKASGQEHTTQYSHPQKERQTLRSGLADSLRQCFHS